MKHFFYFVFLFFSAFSVAQQAEYVDFKTANSYLWVVPDSSIVGGKVWYSFDILKPVDSIYLDAKDMKIENVEIRYGDSNVQDVDYNYDGRSLWLKDDFTKGIKYTVYFDYSVKPKKALYFVRKDGDVQVWTQGQGKYTSNWLPSIDDVNDKIVFKMSIFLDDKYEVISNGFKSFKTPLPDSTAKWHYDMQKPMSSYLVALAIGKYDKKVEYSKSGIPLEMYYYPEDSLKVEPTYRYTKQMFDFLEEEIGVPYPWQNYKQVPVHDFLYAGMENTSCTIFSDAFMVDEIAFVDKNYVNVNAHELAHQWFGDLVTAKSGEHHWLQEGFATYYALLAERDLFGDDYYYWRLYEYAQELLEQDKEGKSTSLLNPKSSSITFYKKGAWVLHMLREKVGDKTFKSAVKSYLEKHQFKNVETNDFIGEVEKVSGEDLSEFVRRNIVDRDSFSTNLMKESLYIKLFKFKKIENINCKIDSKSKSSNKYLNLDWDKSFRNYDSNSKIELFNRLLKDSLIKKNDLYKTVFQSKDIKLRQTITQTLTEIPEELKQDYESLLNDKSYMTIETALYNLWNNFPEDRAKYLNQTNDVNGFNNKNVRLLWLVLALSTPDYQPEQSKKYYDELVDYTSPKYNYELRQNAFQYLLMLKSCKIECKENLEQATTHHNWRLSKFAKEQLKLINTN